MEFLCFLPFMFLGIAATAFWIWMLVDCLTNESSQGNDKLVWVLVIVLTNWIGALIYCFVRRPQREEERRMENPHADERFPRN